MQKMIQNVNYISGCKYIIYIYILDDTIQNINFEDNKKYINYILN